MLTEGEINDIKDAAVDLFPIYPMDKINWQIHVDQMRSLFVETTTAALSKEKGLLDCLNRVRNECPKGSWFEKTITKAINEYNKKSSLII